MTNNPPLAQLAEATDLKSVKSEFESLKGDHPIYNSRIYKIYGPYESKKDYRLRVVVYDGFKRITISYPKFIIECFLKRQLEIDEDIHHADHNIKNNLISNFEIMDSTEHRKGHTKYQDAQILHCVRCNKEVILNRLQMYNLTRNMSRGTSSGVHCNRCWNKA